MYIKAERNTNLLILKHIQTLALADIYETKRYITWQEKEISNIDLTVRIISRLRKQRSKTQIRQYE